jgi:hypothetical protein
MATVESSRSKTSQFMKGTGKQERANITKRTPIITTKDITKFQKIIIFRSPNNSNTISEAWYLP